MAIALGRILEFDGTQFADAFGQQPLGVSHTLADHPLLTLEAIADLADRIPLENVERHTGNQPLLNPDGAPDLTGQPSETVLGIETNGCWMVLWFIEQVPEYKQLMDDVLAVAAESVGSREGGMAARRREAFLFLSAPGALTPVHFDPEHNFLLQIRGVKDMNVRAFLDQAVQRVELERYYAGGHRNLAAMPDGETRTFTMHPGDGVYVPPFAPHWVQNGDRPSISLSITFRSRESERFERVHEFNGRLRRVGLHPKPYGASDSSDRVKELAFVTTTGWKKRLAGARALVAGNGHSGHHT
jgi:hypothetical protein